MVMSTNKTEIFEVNYYGDLSANGESTNNFYIFYFTYAP